MTTTWPSLDISCYFIAVVQWPHPQHTHLKCVDEGQLGSKNLPVFQWEIPSFSCTSITTVTKKQE